MAVANSLRIDPGNELLCGWKKVMLPTPFFISDFTKPFSIIILKIRGI
jgi:hypothetical protein